MIRRLEQARDYALTGGGSGYITRGGKLVISWGEARKTYDLKSTSKSIGVTALGLAIADGKISLDDQAATHHPKLGTPPDSNAERGWLDEITIRHLATQTAGFAKPGGYQELLFRPGDKWHLDDVFLTINGERHYLWQAVDQDDNVLDILVQSRRNKQAAKKFFRKLLKGLSYVPRVVITDKLKSYSAAKREILPGVEHRQSRYLNNRCENSHLSTRQRERRMQRFKSPGHAQRFLSVYGPIAQHFRPRRHLLRASEYRQEMAQRFEIWQDITGMATA